MHGKHLHLSLAVLLLLIISSNSQAARCLFISSYHQGYPWADGIEEGVRKTLASHCDIHQIDMDTKRNKSEAYKKAKGIDVRNFIQQWQPDVIIAADDNASKYVIQPFFGDSKIPIVFCGINWTVKEYGYPYANVTGMIEVAPINELFNTAKHILPQMSTASYIGADTLTEQKAYERFNKVAQKNNIKLEKRLASNLAQWQEYYIQAQKNDFIILGTKSGIPDWNDAMASATVHQYGQKLSLTVYKWMVEFALLGMHKIPQEQGEWAAKVALRLLDGASPINIPIIPNQRWDILINPEIQKNSGITLPAHLLLKSKVIHEQ
jgi:ABC-type uncharacterized transport system substrate-binding protein